MKNMSLWMLIIVIYQFGCTSNRGKDEVSDEIVLKVGSVEITKYEFEKNKKQFEQSNTQIGSKALKTWLNGFIERAYILADAYKKRYDTIQSLNKTLNYASADQIAKVNGYVWAKVEEPKLQVSESELKEAYEKRDQLYHIEYLYFPNIELLDSVLKNDKAVKNPAQFNHLIQASKENTTIKYNNDSFLWPFDFFEPVKEKIYSLNEGDVVGPLNLPDGYYILHLVKKEKKMQQTFDKEKDPIVWQIRDARTLQIAEAKQKEIFSKTNIVINEDEVNKLSGQLKKLQINQIRENSGSIDKKMQNEVLMTYSINKSQKCYAVRDFMDYIRYAPVLAGDYYQKEAIMECLHDQIIAQYIFLVADSLGILKEKKYLLDRKNFMNNLLETYYDDKEFFKQITITDKEISDYYENNKTSYTIGKVSIVSFLTFKDKDAAIENRSRVEQIVYSGQFYNLKDTSTLKGLITYQPNLKIEFTNKEYSPEIINQIFSLQENQVSMPIEQNKNYILFFVTKRDGQRIKELNEVKEQLKMELTGKKIDGLKSKRVTELKKKYPMVINKTDKLL